MYIYRKISKRLLKLANMYPILFVTGPRQSGKSTLIKEVFKTYEYINLENPDIKKLALADPSGFVRSLKTPTIIDEAQNAPEIFSALQAKVDEDQQDGYFILSGSQNFSMNKKIKQSLAGRVAIAQLLPCSFNEIATTKHEFDPIDIMLKGMYPAIYSKKITSEIFYENYIGTYLQRDVTDIIDIRNISAFNKFVGICAAHSGQLINYAKLARLAGITVPTVKAWLSILEQSYIIYFVRPYFQNRNKTLTKTPKMYFYDSGLLAHLLYVNRENYFFNNYKGAIFENFVITELVKNHFNNLERSNLYYYRDDSKLEVDVYDLSTKGHLFAEIKSGSTYDTKFSKTVRKVADELNIPIKDRAVIYAGIGNFNDSGVNVLGVREFLKSLK